MADFVTALRSGKVLVMDGAMGTELLRLAPARRRAGADSSGGELIRSIHSAYAAAGAEILLTNTFQVQRHSQWQAAIHDARAARPKAPFLLGDIGPIERVTPTLAAALVAECEGLDGFLLETWSSLPALGVFAKAARMMPLLVSFTFLHLNGEIVTFEGKRPEDCARAAKKCGTTAVGANCGNEIDMHDMLQIVQRYRTACDLPIFVRPNAGTPKRTRSGWRYPHTPHTMATRLPALLEAGVTMVGGCCGTTPEYIRAFRKVVDVWNARIKSSRARRV